MKKLIVLLPLMILTLTACLPTHLLPVEPQKTEVFDSFETGTPVTVNVGERLFHFKKYLSEYAGFEATKDFQLPRDHNVWSKMPVVSAGTRCVIKKRTGDYYVCKPTNAAWLTSAGGVSFEFFLLVDREMSPVGTARCVIGSCNGGVFLYLWEKKTEVSAHEGATDEPPIEKEQKSEPKKFDFALKPIRVPEESTAIGMEIIYMGRGKDGVRLAYREPGEKDLEFIYDLQESNVIGIKGVEFEVLKATNTHITVVIKTPAAKINEIIKGREKSSDRRI